MVGKHPENGRRIVKKLREIHGANAEESNRLTRELLLISSTHLQLYGWNEELHQNYTMVSNDFYERLNQKFPNLSEGEKKLCAQLRLGYTTKDIAALKNASTKSVEMSRYRLRRKMGLSANENLSQFLKNL